MNGRRVAAAAVVVLAAVLAGLGASAWLGDGGRTPTIENAADTGDADYLYVIPAGTAALIDRGEKVEILPERLQAHVGETLRIVNDDDRGHLVGPFFVAAGQTLSQTFASAGELVGLCTVHPSGRFVLDVVP